MSSERQRLMDALALEAALGAVNPLNKDEPTLNEAWRLAREQVKQAAAEWVRVQKG